MQVETADRLTQKKCKPCEGGVEPATLEEAREQLTKLSGWQLTPDGQRIRKEWTMKHFMAAMRFFNECARIAEEDQHHPDLHLTSYRNVTVELWTHAIGGLSENDFILAAKIDQIPVELRKQ